MAYGFRAHLMNLSVYCLGLIPLTFLITQLEPQASFNATRILGPFDKKVTFLWWRGRSWTGKSQVLALCRTQSWIAYSANATTSLALTWKRWLAPLCRARALSPKLQVASAPGCREQLLYQPSSAGVGAILGGQAGGRHFWAGVGKAGGCASPGMGIGPGCSVTASSSARAWAARLPWTRTHDFMGADPKSPAGKLEPPPVQGHK